MPKHPLTPFIGLIIFVVLAVAGTLIFAGNKPQNAKLKIVASFYPLAHFAEQVGGDQVEVTTVTPSGAEPHDFEPTAQDIVKVNQAQLFIYNGNGVEGWGEAAKKDVEANGNIALNMSRSLSSVSGQSDPHFWLDPIIARQEVELIRQALVQIDPAHTDYYTKRADAYDDRLAKLDEDFRTGLAHCQLHDIVTAHNAFNYLAQRYNLTATSISGISPDEEPSPQKLGEIARLVRQKNIKYIFFEELVSPKLSETIAREAGVQTLAFNPLEGLSDKDIAAGKTYVSEMENNLGQLRVALQCQ